MKSTFVIVLLIKAKMGNKPNGYTNVIFSYQGNIVYTMEHNAIKRNKLLIHKII